MKNDSNLFFTCSLIEFIGRRQKLKRSEVAAGLGEKNLRRIYEYADVFHCEPIEKTADEFITRCGLPNGDFDNEDVCGDDTIGTLQEVYASWIDGSISDYKSDFYCQPRDYIRECYREGKIL